MARRVILAEINAVLDAWLEVRVAAHNARGGSQAAVRAIGVPLYMQALRVVRLVEDVLEPIRRELGAPCSRAYEIVTTAEQLSLEIAG
jgi:hypothetical protein